MPARDRFHLTLDIGHTIAGIPKTAKLLISLLLLRGAIYGRLGVNGGGMTFVDWFMA